MDNTFPSDSEAKGQILYVVRPPMVDLRDKVVGPFVPQPRQPLFLSPSPPMRPGQRPSDVYVPLPCDV